MAENKYRCPVCGELSFARPDDFEACDVCGWQNDTWQEKHPDTEGGGTTNIVSLNDFRRAWQEGRDPFEGIPDWDDDEKDNSAE